MATNKIYVHNPGQLPTGEHWAIIEGESIVVPGDLRSQTNPGHGYPEHTEQYITYVAYTDKELFERDLADKLKAKSWASTRRVAGIHVSGIYTGELKIQLSEKA